MGRACAVVLLGLLPVAATAQAGRVAQEWQAWLADQDGAQGALVFGINGSELLAEGPVDTPMSLASLSKAITAQCVADLVAAGLVRWDQPISRYYGPGPGDAITLADLVTHRSGLWPDSTQKAMARWRDDPTPRWGEVTAKALGRARQRGTVGVFRYNNENYAILGDIIELITGEPYVAACHKRVLAPLGLGSARASAAFGGYAPWGGWDMSVRDYARLMQARYAGADPRATPSADMGGGAFYGLGMVFRTGRGGANHWHFGLLCFADLGLGAYAVNWGGRYTVVATYDRCTSDKAMGALDQAMIRAVFSD